MPADRLPPHSVEAEQAVLGALLLDSATWSQLNGLVPQDFYRGDHRTIFGVMTSLAANGSPFDAVILGDALERARKLQDAGGLGYLGQLVRETAGTANIETYAGKVREYSLRRRLQAFAAAIDRDASDGCSNSDALLARAQDELMRLHTSARTGKGLRCSRDLASEFVDDLDSRRDRQRGLEIGLHDFDELTRGLEPGDLVVLAGRPAMGKTALLVSISKHVAREHNVAVFSAEMPSIQVIRRGISDISSVPQGRLRQPEQLTDNDWVRISSAATDVSALKLSIDDTPLPTLAHIRAECMAHKARTGLDLIIVDYVQLVQGSGANRYEQLRDVSYGLKALAKDLSVPVIVLAQLNRGVESRDERRPNASDLRDSGAIEEAADIVGLLYSQAHYDPSFAMPDVLECRVAKHRNGERGDCLWSFNGALSRITVLDDGDRYQYRQLLAQGRRKGNDDL